MNQLWELAMTDEFIDYMEVYENKKYQTQKV